MLEDDRSFVQLYSDSESWIWDYNDQNATPVTGPSAVTTYPPDEIEVNFPPSSAVVAGTTDESTTTPTGESGGGETTLPTGTEGADDGDAPADEPVQLLSPVFSLPGGSVPVTDFALQLSLVNPNPGGSSSLFYQVDYGPWIQIASGVVFDVEPDQTIGAQAVGIDQMWLDSSKVEQFYSATAVKLTSPTINLSAASFGVLDRRVIAVVLEDTNTDPDTPSTLQYQLNDGEWFAYDSDGYLLLDRVDFENGVSINARATSNDSNYLTSDLAGHGIAVDPMNLTGAASGDFYNPNSKNPFALGMVTNLNYTNSGNDYFEWGRISDFRGNAYNDLNKSWMDFETQDVAGINLGGQFQIGSLDYFNGNFVANSGADSVDLGIELALNIDGLDIMSDFNYEFDLIDTISNDPDVYGWDSADYVQIDRASSSTMFEVDGVVFELVLEFGDASTNSFATIDEFHVREEFSASTNLYATLFDRTASQGTVDNSGKVIEVADIKKAIAADGSGIIAPVDTSSSKSEWWSALASWLAGFDG